MPIPLLPPRSYHAQIAALQARIVMAESERDSSRAMDEKKLILASQHVDELLLELWLLRLQHLRDHTGAS